MSRFTEILSTFEPERGVQVAKTVLLAHYQQQEKAPQEMVAKLEQINRKSMELVWRQLFDNISNHEEAFSLFLRYLEEVAKRKTGSPVVV